MLLKSINQHVLNLISSGNVDEPDTLTVPSMRVESIYPICKELFTDRAKLYLENKTHNLIHEHNRYHEDPRGYLLNMLYALLPKKREHIREIFNKWNVKWKREFDKVNFVGSCSTKENIELAISKVANTVNHLADKGFMRAALEPLCIIRFAQIPGQPDKYAILSYVTLTEEGEKYFNTQMPKMVVSEGAVPTMVEEQ